MKKMVEPTVTLFYPTPVVLVTCSIEGGDPNIITIAWTGVVCSEPPLVGVAIRPERHSHSLIEKSGRFGLNFPTKEELKQVDFCGVASGKKVNKFKECAFSILQGEKTGVPLIAECPVNMECVVTHSLNLGSHTHFIGEIVAAYVKEELWEDRSLKATKALPLAYLPPTAEYVPLGEALGRYCLSKGRL